MVYTVPAETFLDEEPPGTPPVVSQTLDHHVPSECPVPDKSTLYMTDKTMVCLTTSRWLITFPRREERANPSSMESCEAITVRLFEDSDKIFRRDANSRG